MFLLNTEEKLLNAEFEDLDDLVEAYYFFVKQNYVTDEFEEKFIKKNSSYNLTSDELVTKVNDYGDFFTRRVGVLIDKIKNSTFIRRKVKEFSKIVGKDISQTKLKKHLSTQLGITVAKIADLKYQMCLNEETCNQLFELILQESLLKNEFVEVVKKSIQDTSLRMNKGAYDFELCYTFLIAQFYVDYYDYQQQNITYLKNQINNLIHMSNEEISNLAEELNKNDEEVQEKYDQDLINENELTEKITNAILPIDNKIEKFDGIEQKMFEVDGLDVQTEMLISNKTHESVKKYFLYNQEDEEQLVEEYFFKTANVYHHFKNPHNNNFIQKCASYLITIFDYFKNDILNVDVNMNNGYSFLITRDFMLFLTHYLLTGPVDFKEELLDLCQDLLNKNLIVANNYTEYMNSFDDAPYVLKYPPDQLYECVCLMAVLKEIDSDKSIMKRFRRLLIKYYKEVNDNLPQVNLKEHEFYFEIGVEKTNELLHQYAITFMFNYFKDPIYIAPLSVFIFEFEQVINDYLMFYQYNETLIEYIGDENKIKGNRALERAQEYFIEIEKLIENLDEINIDDMQDRISMKYTLLFISSIHRGFVYDDFFNCIYMLKKYQKNLALMISFNVNEITKNFKEWNNKEKIDFLWNSAIQMALIKEVFVSYKYIPKVFDLSKDNYTKTLEKSNKELNQQIQKRDTEILTLKNQIKSLNEVIQKENTAKNNELAKSFNKEIHELNKNLVQKDRKIEKLEESQEELYKLRSLMFSLENNQLQENNENRDHESFLSKISNKKKIVFIGGHINLINALKNKYSHMIFITGEKAVSHQVISHADYVFFFYNFLSHTLYYKVMNLLYNNRNVKWDYISARNLNLVEMDLYQKLTKK